MRLSGLLEDIVSNAQVQARQKHLSFRTVVEQGVPDCVQADQMRLRQILLNLVNNALKFTDDGSVTVHVEPWQDDVTGGNVKFSVVDTGIGIAKEKQERIFETFTQADGTMTRRFGGTGLGTSISRQLVELMGGRMGLESTEGQGSTFWFVLPLEAAAGPVEDDWTEQIRCELPPDESVETARILVAEDYPPNQDVARMHLESHGHIVDIAENGLEAVNRCKRRQYDMVLMDVQMPEMNGMDATREIRKLGGRNETMPIIGLTANAEMDTRLECAEAGMNDVIAKPIRRKPLLSMVIGWLSGESELAEQAESPDRPAEEPDAPQARDFRADTSHPAPAGDDVGLANMPIDLKRAATEFGGDRELMMTVLTSFLETADEQIQPMQRAAGLGDAEILRTEAHRIKGGAANLTAMALSQAAAEVEVSAKQGDLDQAGRALETLVQEFQTLKDYVRNTG
jgi:CheY-like chemotaxis protein